ncbi:hypothetical protein HK104_004532, partial [Borealophlyctis nickersoniae]
MPYTSTIPFRGESTAIHPRVPYPLPPSHFDSASVWEDLLRDTNRGVGGVGTGVRSDGHGNSGGRRIRIPIVDVKETGVKKDAQQTSAAGTKGLNIPVVTRRGGERKENVDVGAGVRTGAYGGSTGVVIGVGRTTGARGGSTGIGRSSETPTRAPQGTGASLRATPASVARERRRLLDGVGSQRNSPTPGSRASTPASSSGTVAPTSGTRQRVGGTTVTSTSYARPAPSINVRPSTKTFHDSVFAPSSGEPPRTIPITYVSERPSRVVESTRPKAEYKPTLELSERRRQLADETYYRLINPTTIRPPINPQVYQSMALRAADNASPSPPPSPPPLVASSTSSPRTTPSPPLLDPSTPNSPRSLIIQALLAEGYTPRDVPGTGDCLFSALSDQTWGTPTRHLEMRRTIADEIEMHRDVYEADIRVCEAERNTSSFNWNLFDDLPTSSSLPTGDYEDTDPTDSTDPFTSYISRIRTPGQVGDAICIAAYASLFNCDVVVHVADEKRGLESFTIEGPDPPGGGKREVKHLAWYPSEVGVETANHYFSVYPPKG